ncbi:MAG TPA: cell division FtsA domain-containing protein [Spirochaetia bacterium]|nr:cell division FtsA domain-containing protein [Spirochaetia bacterium]
MKKTPAPENTIFALDIGTRTVIGLVGVPKSGKLGIVAQHLVEHERRTMLDGQIHDIPGVAGAVREVVHHLEEKTGFGLQRVAIAAAGRSLITGRGRAEQNTEGRRADWPEVEALTMAAVRQAHREVETHTPGLTCVGHSVLSYYLDGYSINNLVGHRGQSMAAEVLATFLPDSVVNSLYAVLEIVGLEPFFLTLEPIAAIEAAIPENYRLLNLALVDIGAGTADIAVTKDGIITAYDMVPLAGDEITEAIMQACLVDFDTAERMKRDMGSREEISFTDITGASASISRTQLLDVLDPVLDNLAGAIAGHIRSANAGNPPRSVFLVGGGGQVPEFPQKLAGRLDLDPGRVVLRNRENCLQLEGAPAGTVAGPDGVTVAGIALVALRQMGRDFIQVLVNGREHRLFNTGDFTVASVLGLTDYDPRRLLGYDGPDLHCTLNGRPVVVPGELATPAGIWVNDVPANLKTRVVTGDRLVIQAARDGAAAWSTVAGLCPAAGAEGTVCLVNGDPATPDRPVAEGDVLEVRVTAPPSVQPSWEGPDPGPENTPASTVIVRVNGQPVHLAGKPEYLLVDIFSQVNIDLSRVKPPIVITINGRNAGFTDPLAEGDAISLTWGDGANGTNFTSGE